MESVQVWCFFGEAVFCTQSGVGCFVTSYSRSEFDTNQVEP